MSRMFTNIAPGQGASNVRQRNDLKNAAKLKSKIVETGKRLHRLDGKDADLAEKKDVVHIEEQTKLPKSIGHYAKIVAFGALAGLGHLEKSATVDSAYSTKENGELKNMMARTTSEGKTETLDYRKDDDGTEVYTGPTGDGKFMIVKENKAQGTLFIATDSQPLDGTFGTVFSKQFDPPKSSEETPVVAPPVEQDSNSSKAADTPVQSRIDTNFWKPASPINTGNS